MGQRLFAAFDTNNSGAIDLAEFAIGCAMCSRGTYVFCCLVCESYLMREYLRSWCNNNRAEEKMAFLFRMFDEDRNGYIDKKELSKMLSTGFFRAAQMTGSSSAQVCGNRRLI